MAILDFNGNRSFVGRCIRESESNRYDDSDFFMLVWNDTTGKPESKLFATTRAGCGKAYGSKVDADEVTLAKFDLYCERHSQAGFDAKRKTSFNRARALRQLEAKVPGYVKLRKAYCPRLSFMDPRVIGGRDNGLDDYLSLLDLLSNKRIRSNFKLQLRAQVQAWIDDEAPRYAKPLSDRQMACLPLKGFETLADEIHPEYASIAVFNEDVTSEPYIQGIICNDIVAPIIPVKKETNTMNDTIQRLLDLRAKCTTDELTSLNRIILEIDGQLNMGMSQYSYHANKIAHLLSAGDRFALVPDHVEHYSALCDDSGDFDDIGMGSYADSYHSAQKAKYGLL
jgi:hypothetical protein